LDLQVLLPFFLYFVLLIAIGLYTSKKSIKTTEELFGAGKKLNRFVVALSAVISGRSAWLLLGFTSLVYMIGLSAIWSAIGYILVEMFLFLFYAPKIHQYTDSHNCVTIPDIFEARFNDKKGSLRILLTFIFFVFIVAYLSAQFVAGGKAFFAYFELNQHVGMIITASIVLVYVLFGGYLAAGATDMVQAFFMIIALIGLPIIGILNVEGFNVITNELASLPQLNNMQTPIAGSEGMMLNPMALSFLALLGGLGIGLGSTGSPRIIMRYMAINEAKQFKWIAFIGTIWNILLAGGALFIGLIGRAYFTEISTLPNADPENIYVSLAERLFMPISPMLIGLLLASIFAAIMSTADSQLFVIASSVVRDVYVKMIRGGKEISQTRLSVYVRLVVVLIISLSVLLGLLVDVSVFSFVLFAWAGLGASLGPASILTLFWKRTTQNGVIAGFLSGSISVFIWKLTPFLSNLIYELVPAFFISVGFTIVISLLDKNAKTQEQMQIDEISVDNIHEIQNISDKLINND